MQIEIIFLKLLNSKVRIFTNLPIFEGENEEGDHRTCPTSVFLLSKIGKFVNSRNLEHNNFKNIISACLLTLILVTSISDKDTWQFGYCKKTFTWRK